MKKKVKLSVLIPVRNEGKNIGIMLKKLDELVKFPSETLVIYDSETDNTMPAVKKLQPRYKNVKLVQNKLGKGVANAIRTGISTAKGNYLLILAADDFGPIPAINDMTALMDEGCDFISATRYAYGGKRDKDSVMQEILSKIGNRLFRVLSGSVFTDITTGFKMFRKSILGKINLESDSSSWAIVFEMAIKAQAAGLKLGEVPVISNDRFYGKSTFKLGPWFKEYLKWFLWGVRHLHGVRKQRILVRIPSNIKNG